MYYLAPFIITKGSNSNRNGSYISIIKVHLADIKEFEKLDEFLLLPFQDIKEKPKCYKRTDGQHENRIPPHKHSFAGVYENGTYNTGKQQCRMVSSLVKQLKYK